MTYKFSSLLLIIKISLINEHALNANQLSLKIKFIDLCDEEIKYLFDHKLNVDLSDVKYCFIKLTIQILINSLQQWNLMEIFRSLQYCIESEMLSHCGWDYSILLQ